MIDDDEDDGALFAALSQQLQHLPIAPQREAALRTRLFDRVATSAAEQRRNLTVRRETGDWQPLAPGVQARALRQGGGMRVQLLQLQPGAGLPWPADVQAQELLVIDGALQRMAQPDDALAPQSYLVMHAAGEAAAWQAAQPSLLYVRQRLAGHTLPALEAAWWAGAPPQGLVVRAGRRGWADNRPGVQTLALCGNREVVSMLVRFEPGASVPDHHHALDEDCLMLSGEMYLGDTLLRPLDYQLAPAGGRHEGEMSERGGTFFFHGALDPVLLG